MEDLKILDSIHMNIHGLRLIKGYKPSEFETRTAKLIVDKYKDICEECKEVANRPPVEQKNFLNKLGDLMK